MIHPIATIGLFTDPHFAHLVYGDRHCEDSLHKLSACVEIFSSRGLDTAINLGDFIDKAEDKHTEFENLNTIRGVFEHFQGSRHFVIGNHDVATLTKSEFLAGCGTATEKTYYAFDCHGVRCVVLDSNCHRDGRDFSEGDFDWDNAWISDSQIAWLSTELSSAHDQQVLVFCHGNLDGRLWNGQLDPHVVKNATSVRALLEDSGVVRAVIQGHYHTGLANVVGCIPYIGLRAMVVGPGLDQNAYAILSVFEDGRLELEGFGKQPSISISADGEITS
jgi:3',5'-cyclic AMP phosphodiesterase CpdA